MCVAPLLPGFGFIPQAGRQTYFWGFATMLAKVEAARLRGI